MKEKIELYNRLQGYLQSRDLFVQDCYAGADENYRLPVRIITEYAWHSHFARNMLIPCKNADEYRRHVPEFTIIAAPSFRVDPRIDGTRSETAIILDFAERITISALHGTAVGDLLPSPGVLVRCIARSEQRLLAHGGLQSLTPHFAAYMVTHHIGGDSEDPCP